MVNQGYPYGTARVRERVGWTSSAVGPPVTPFTHTSAWPPLTSAAVPRTDFAKPQLMNSQWVFFASPR